MLRIIDLDQLTKEQESQTVFTFLSGTERHGIQASELFDWLRSRVMQGANAKGGRKTSTQRKSTPTEAFDSIEGQGGMLADANAEMSEDTSLS